MSSTYSSSLRVELIGSGDQAGTWGTTADNNFAYIFDTAIAGYQAVTITSTSQLLTSLNGPTSSAALNQSVYAILKFNSASAATNIFAPPVSKQYIIWNNSGYAITIYNSAVINVVPSPITTTGVTIANGDKIMVWSDGTNFYDVKSNNVTGTVAIANGGTGQVTANAAFNALAPAQTANRLLKSDGTNTSFAQAVLTTDVTGTLPVANGGTGVTTSTGTGNNVLSSGFTITGGTINSTTINSSTLNSPGLVTPALGTPSSGTLTNCTFPTLNQNTTGSAATVTGNATGSTFGFNSGYGSVATAYGCRAWVRFNAAGTIAASGNVTSVTKNATGDYTINFTTAMPDANYAASIVSQSNGGIFDAACVKDGTAPTTAALRVFNCSATTGAGRDPQLMYVAVFR
jgi:hypothetical protein